MNYENAPNIDEPVLYRKTQPFSVRVKNTDDSPHEVKLFCVNQLFNPNERNPHLKIESALPGITYTEMCVQLMTSPCIIGMMYVSVPSKGAPNSDKVLSHADVLSLHSKDARGNHVIIPLILQLDPYQFQIDLIRNNNEFGLDGLTTLTFKLLGNNSIRIDLYPCRDVTIARALREQPLMKKYSGPGFLEQGLTPVAKNQVTGLINDAVSRSTEDLFHSIVTRDFLSASDKETMSVPRDTLADPKPEPLTQQDKNPEVSAEVEQVFQGVTQQSVEVPFGGFLNDEIIIPPANPSLSPEKKKKKSEKSGSIKKNVDNKRKGKSTLVPGKINMPKLAPAKNNKTKSRRMKSSNPSE